MAIILKKLLLMGLTTGKITSKYGNLWCWIQAIIGVNQSKNQLQTLTPHRSSSPEVFTSKQKNLGDGGWRELHFETHSLKNIALQNLQFDWYEISFHFLFLFQFLAQVAPFLVTPLCCCPPESSFSFRNWWEKGSICWPFIIMELYFQTPLFQKMRLGGGIEK